MGIGRVLTWLVVVWLVIGAIAVFQRGDYKDGPLADCGSVGTIAITVVAGPLNYVGVNPDINCEVPEPSQ